MISLSLAEFVKRLPLGWTSKFIQIMDIAVVEWFDRTQKYCFIIIHNFVAVAKFVVDRNPL